MDVPEENHLLDFLVEKCVQYMFAELIPPPLLKTKLAQDYDILQAVQTEVGWTVILDPAAYSRIHVFDFKNGDAKIRIETYTKAYSQRIDTF